MGRFVTPQPLNATFASRSPEGDGPAERIVKYVPAEIVSIYVIMINALSGTGLAGVTGQYVVLALIAIFTLGTVAYIWWRAPMSEPDVRRKHFLVTPLSFLAWSYPLSAGLLGAWFVSWIAVIAQGIVLLLALIVIPHKS